MSKIIKSILVTVGFGLAGAAFASSSANWEPLYASSIKTDSTKQFTPVKADAMSASNWRPPYAVSVKPDPNKQFAPVKADASSSYANWE